MRILEIINRLDTAYGGPAAAVRSFSASLASAGATVTLMGPTTGLSPQEQARLRESAELAGYSVVLTDPPWPPRSYGISPSTVRSLIQLLPSVDLIHVHSVYCFHGLAAFLAVHLPRKSNVRIVVRPCGAFDSYQRRQKATKKFLYERLIEFPMDRRVDAIHVVSEYERDQVEQIGLGTPLVLSPVPVTEVINIRHDREPGLIVFLGRLAPKKRVDLAIDAVAHLVANGLDVRLEIAGTGDPSYVRELEARARISFPDTERIRFLGHQHQAEKWQLLQRAQFFILPSEDENFGVAAAEAAMAGCVVVGTADVPVIADLAAQGAAVTVARDAASIADTVGGLVADPSSAVLLTERSVHAARSTYSPASVGGRLLGDLRQLS